MAFCRDYKKRNRINFIPNREELAWAAGFFDGEGSVFVCYYYKGKSGTVPYPQISIGQSGEKGNELLLRFDQITAKLGYIYGPRPVAKNQKKVRWQYETSGHVRVQTIMCMLWPWLGSVKKEQFKNIWCQYIESYKK